MARISAPIGIVDEHPEWSNRLIGELEHRRLPYEKIDHSNHAFDPRDWRRRYSVIVNRSSPSSHRRGHGSVLDARYLYAIRIVRGRQSFNLCPADVCQVPPPAPVAGACPVDAAATLEVTRFEPPAEAVHQAVALTRAASIDVGGVEYLVNRADGQIYFYDVNATSNFVADAPNVLGFDPFKPFVDFIERKARQRSATALPGRSERVGGLGGPFLGPLTTQDTPASGARRPAARRPGRAARGGRTPARRRAARA